jgi:hypothetical protein
MRSLTAKEFGYAERIKFEVLCQLEPLIVVNEETVQDALSLGSIDSEYHTMLNAWVAETKDILKRPLTVEEIRNIRAKFYIQYREDTFPLI